jgi:hypothetical protein
MEEQVRFPVGGITLEGLLWLPSGAPRSGAVVCHPHPLYGGDMHNNVVAALVAGLQGAGVATLRFNFRGVGASGGNHDSGKAELEDVKAAVSCLLGRQALATVAVCGYSFGSLVGLEAGAADPRVDRLVGVALPIARRDASFLESVGKPKLFIGGDGDEHSPAEAMQRLVDRLPEPTSLVLVEGADHFFSGLEDRVAEAAAAFLAA